MKVYKVTLMVIDHDYLGQSETIREIESVNYPNDCISPTVVDIEARDIGEWRDDHPLNRRDGAIEEFRRMFAKVAP